MDSRSRKILAPHVKGLPASFDSSFTEEQPWDDFINYVEGSLLCRVIRVVGASRCLLFWVYDTKESHTYVRGHRRLNNRFLILNEAGEYLSYEPPEVPTGRSWDAFVGAHMKEAGARCYNGHGWAQRCSGDIMKFLPLWTAGYSVRN